jgi:hypothetical protein
VRSRFAPIADAVLGPLVRRKLRQPINTTAGSLTQAQVEQIAEDCGAPRDSVQVDGGELLIYPNSDFMITGRVLKALQETGETSLSAIGNQRHKMPGKS